jgi:hypothetical protein
MSSAHGVRIVGAGGPAWDDIVPTGPSSPGWGSEEEESRQESPEIITEIDVPPPPVEVFNDVEIAIRSNRQAYEIGDMYGDFKDGVEVWRDSNETFFLEKEEEEEEVHVPMSDTSATGASEPAPGLDHDNPAPAAPAPPLRPSGRLPPLSLSPSIHSFIHRRCILRWNPQPRMIRR